MWKRTSKTKKKNKIIHEEFWRPVELRTKSRVQNRGKISWKKTLSPTEIYYNRVYTVTENNRRQKKMTENCHFCRKNDKTINEYGELRTTN